MKRNNLLDMLRDCKGFDQEENEMITDTIRFINCNENCFDRELLAGHITGSSWILNSEYTHALLIHHYKLDKWFQPGGHCDGNSNVLDVAVKEALEETGLVVTPISNDIFDVDIHIIPQRKDLPQHLHYDIRFLFTATKTVEILPNNHETEEVRWVYMEDIKMYNSESSIMRMVEKSKLLAKPRFR